MQVSLSDLQRDYRWFRSQTSWASSTVASNNSKLCTFEVKLEVLQARLQRQHERLLELVSAVERLQAQHTRQAELEHQVQQLGARVQVLECREQSSNLNTLD
jgi:hypothetical protein